ncbi:MAG: tripartite tricarboxylate transporter TctB family protein [Proteobacteria bacterium]|nr:tripartite tricarboxylate transporter TctB family protein [Pseudomonadota bacterium]
MAQTYRTRAMALIRRRDVAAGLFLLAFGAVIVTGAAGLRIGTPTRMGAGFLPLALGLLLALVGLVLTVQGARSADLLPKIVSLRPLIALILAFLVFALMVEEAGLALSTFVVVIVSGFATPGRKWRETVLYAALLALFAVLLFVVLLKLPLTVWP